MTAAVVSTTTRGYGYVCVLGLGLGLGFRLGLNYSDITLLEVYMGIGF